MAQFAILSLAIGHGPATPGTFGSIIMIVLGILFVALALAPGTRLRGAFSHGKGSSVPIGSAGRVITLLIALVLLTVGLQGIFH
jgi:uncharacterized protein YacL